MHPLLILKLLILLAVANGVPVIAKRILGDRFAYPADLGMNFPDGERLYGPTKTVRGVGLSIFATAAVAPLLGFPLKIGALIAAAAMVGDLLSSFVKRRLKIPPSGQALGLDQIPESLFPLLACMDPLQLSIPDIAAGVAVFFVGELLVSRLLFKLHLRDRPY